MTSPLLKQYTQQARDYYKAKKKKKGDNIKISCLPAFAPCGHLLGGKGRENLIGLTGLCFIDIDKVGKEQVENAMVAVRNDEHVLLASRSISGKGLHLLVPYHLWREDPTCSIPATPEASNEIYGCVFRSTAARYHDLLQLPIDPSAENAERLCLISYDDRAHYNHAATPLVLRYEHHSSGRKSNFFSEYKED